LLDKAGLRKIRPIERKENSGENEELEEEESEQESSKESY